MQSRSAFGGLDKRLETDSEHLAVEDFFRDHVAEPLCDQGLQQLALRFRPAEFRNREVPFGDDLLQQPIRFETHAQPFASFFAALRAVESDLNFWKPSTVEMVFL